MKKMLAISLAALACTSLFAAHKNKEQRFYHSSSSSCSSSSSKHHKCKKLTIAHASATDTTPFTIDCAGFKKIPFTENKDTVCPGIMLRNGTDFILKKGHYLVSFSASSTVEAQQGNAVFYEFAAFLDGIEYLSFTESAEIDFDNTKISSFTLEVIAHHNGTVLNIEGTVDTGGSVVSVNNRAITIVKLK